MRQRGGRRAGGSGYMATAIRPRPLSGVCKVIAKPLEQQANLAQ